MRKAKSPEFPKLKVNAYRVGLIILISDSKQNLLMYMEGDKSIAGKISRDD